MVFDPPVEHRGWVPCAVNPAEAVAVEYRPGDRPSLLWAVQQPAQGGFGGAPAYVLVAGGEHAGDLGVALVVLVARDGQLRQGGAIVLALAAQVLVAGEAMIGHGVVGGALSEVTGTLQVLPRGNTCSSLACFLQLDRVTGAPGRPQLGSSFKQVG
ncbi:hypothetical protein [Amycolatopsis magusensis]|uniref:hypothetical protein n=1 Tax=Amycolatopsis magusensis TaxID=882444 RepID=UPI0037940AFB